MQKVSLILALAVAVPSFAFAAIDLTGVSFDVTSVEALAGLILVALAALWPLKKLIRFGNKS